ncbi:MAG TPA: efflux RND transporter permease subunit [Rhodopila sp.]|nr:efflux RND transporter permease subunit [Rhodopila sp.]
MLTAIVRACLTFPRLILLAGLALMLVGALATVNARYDVFPEFGQPTINIETTVAGFAPEQIEALVTTPVENAVNGVPDLVNLRSRSMTGLSVVTAVFRGSSDVYLDRQLLAERLSPLAGSLPDSAMPVIAPLQSSTGTVLAVGLRARKLSLPQLTEIARWTVRPALLAVPGVADVVIFGAEPEQLQVQFDPRRLIEAGIGLDQLSAAARSASTVTASGVIETGNQQIFVQAHGQTTTPATLAGSLLVRHHNQSVTIGDVAHVVIASMPPVGAALVGTHPGLLLVIGSQYGANTLRVTHDLDKALATLAPALERDGVIVEANSLRPASFILNSLRHLRNSLAIGAVLIVVVLFLSLRNWRTAVISFAAIPLSLFAATLILDQFGFSLNTLSLGGLAIAIGEVVDDAVVDVENIHRRLRENGTRPRPWPVPWVVLRASLEVRGVIIFATFAVVLMFLPVLHLSGVAGRLFAPLAVAYIAAILSSLLVALTLTPALALMLLRKAPLETNDPPLMARAKRGYDQALTTVDRHGRLTAGVTVVLCLVALASTPALRTRFLPQFHEDQLILHFRTVPGTSLEAMLSVGKRAADVLIHMPEVAHVDLHAGHATLSNEHGGTNTAEMDVTLTPRGSAEGAKAQQRLLQAVEGAPGVHWTANTFLVERINETLSGQTAPVIATIYGNDLAALNEDADRVAGVLRGIPGSAGITIEAPPGTPELSIALDRAALTRYGFTADQVLQAIHTSYAGAAVAQVYTGSRSFPIVVVLPPNLRADPTALLSTPLVNAEGTLVRLGSVAHIQPQSGQSLILHDAARRVQVVTANVTGGGAAFVARARAQLSGLRLNAGDYVTLGGTATASGQSQLELLLFGLMAVVAVIALLTIALRDGRAIVLLLGNIPFALAGGIVAVWITGMTVSLGAAVGFVTVFGITLRNGLMLLAHYRTLVLEEDMPWSEETARVGAIHRLAPILMTAVVTALGLLPIAIGGNLPGQEIEGPMATVILGGLCSSTMLTLLIMPMLAARFVKIVDFH